MKKSSLGLKGLLLCVGAVIGSLFAPISKKRSEDPAAVRARIEKNIGLIERYIDLKHGEGFFKNKIMEYENRTDMIHMLKTREGSEEYKEYVKTL